MLEEMILFFVGCGFSREEAEKETKIHIKEIQRRELPDLITEEEASDIFMSDVLDC